jgi:hypothetical protein
LDRQKALLAVLAAVLLMMGLRAFWPWLSRLDSPASMVSFGRMDDLDAVTPTLTPLRMKDLEQKPGEYSPGRDPFRFAAKPPPPKPQPRQPQPQPQPQPVQQPVRAAQQRPAGPTPPPVDVKYLGSFGPEDGKIAVFGDGTDIYNVRKGGILKKHFLVESINYESADLKYVNFPKLPATRLAAGS